MKRSILCSFVTAALFAPVLVSASPYNDQVPLQNLASGTVITVLQPIEFPAYSPKSGSMGACNLVSNRFGNGERRIIPAGTQLIVRPKKYSPTLDYNEGYVSRGNDDMLGYHGADFSGKGYRAYVYSILKVQGHHSPELGLACPRDTTIRDAIQNTSGVLSFGEPPATSLTDASEDDDGALIGSIKGCSDSKEAMEFCQQTRQNLLTRDDIRNGEYDLEDVVEMHGWSAADKHCTKHGTIQFRDGVTVQVSRRTTDICLPEDAGKLPPF